MSYTVPKYVKVYEANLTQTGTTVPTVVELTNGISETLEWVYQGVGQYKIQNATEVFPEGRTNVYIGAVEGTIYTSFNGVTGITIDTQAPGGTPTNGMLTNVAFKIVVYNEEN